MAGRVYLPRVTDQLLSLSLQQSGAVWIQGPKWCGKTWTASQQARSKLMLQDPDQHDNMMRQAAVLPSLLLKGATPRLLDEWQTAPVLWDAVRFAVDERGEPGQFILTGSTLPVRSEFMHSGTGRISRLRMRTMSLFESGESSGDVSLRSLFSDATPQGESLLGIEQLAFAVARGGWPASIHQPDRTALAQASNYLSAVADSDISEADGIRRDPRKVRLLMRSMARNISTCASLETIRRDIAGSEEVLAPNTVQAYLDSLERLFVLENQGAWNPRIRSRAHLRKAPKRHFCDPSIAAAALNMGPGALLRDFPTFGTLYESLCIRDLRVYSQALGGDVFHYQDETGLEADAIIALQDGRWAAVEIKLGQRDVDAAAEHLKRLRRVIDEEVMNPPSFLMVLTGNGFAHRRQDNVMVVPIACLRD